MEKEFLIQLIESGLSSNEIAEKINRCQTTVSYWLRRYNLKTKKANKKKGERSSIHIIDGYEYKLCARCKEVKKIIEFNNRKRGGNHCYCKRCLCEQKKERHNEDKRLLVEYKGGSCICCGYDKYNGNLEFHHIDPKEKEFNISQRKKKTLEEIKKELDKCELVCTICHREIHAGIRTLPSLKSLIFLCFRKGSNLQPSHP